MVPASVSVWMPRLGASRRFIFCLDSQFFGLPCILMICVRIYIAERKFRRRIALFLYVGYTIIEPG